MIGVFVEGPDDKGTYPIILEKLGVHPTLRVLRGKGNLLDSDKVERHARTLLASTRNLQKLVVSVDADCEEQATIERAQRCEADLKSRLSVPCRYFVVHYELESWLIQCPETVAAAFRVSIRKPSERQLHNAKGFLQKRLPRYLPSRDLPRLAQCLDVKMLSQRSPNFQDFTSLVADP